MVNSSWDNGGGMEASRTKGSPWGKIFLGCGIVMALILAGIATCTFTTIKKGPELLQRFAGEDWERSRSVVRQLLDDEGSRALYAAHPRLAESWSTEEEFLRQAQAWRSRLSELPATMPNPMKGGLHMNKQYQNGISHTEIAVTTSAGGRVTLIWEGQQLLQLRVD